jgi:CO/xanthine dehydrogenase FAD-binding subunit
MAVAWRESARSRTAPGAWLDVRVALGSVAPVPIRAPRTEAVLEGASPASAVAARAGATLAAEISPIDDVRSTADYRRTVSGRILRRIVVDAGG